MAWQGMLDACLPLSRHGKGCLLLACRYQLGHRASDTILFALCVRLTALLNVPYGASGPGAMAGSDGDREREADARADSDDRPSVRRVAVLQRGQHVTKAGALDAHAVRDQSELGTQGLAGVRPVRPHEGASLLVMPPSLETATWGCHGWRWLLADLSRRMSPVAVARC